MKIAVVDDQASSRALMESFFKRSSQDDNETYEIDFFEDGLHLLNVFHGQYDIIYLDIEMLYMDGMSTARKLREHDQNVLLVFVTNHAQAALQGYEVEASDFLVKPLHYFTFEQHLKKINRRLPKDEEFLFIKISGILERINPKSILFLESHGHYIDIVMANRRITIIDSMKNWEHKLNSDVFYRCSQSYIVNLAEIYKVERNIIYIKKNRLQISRTKKKEFQTVFTKYLGAQLR